MIANGQRVSVEIKVMTQMKMKDTYWRQYDLQTTLLLIFGRCNNFCHIEEKYVKY